MYSSSHIYVDYYEDGSGFTGNKVLKLSGFTGTWNNGGSNNGIFSFPFDNFVNPGAGVGSGGSHYVVIPEHSVFAIAADTTDHSLAIAFDDILFWLNPPAFSGVSFTFLHNNEGYYNEIGFDVTSTPVAVDPTAGT